MSGINQNIIFAISRIFCEFESEINPKICISGTGFFMKNDKGEVIFITNRHNVDPSLTRKESEKYCLSSISIQIRNKQENDIPLKTRIFKMKNFKLKNSSNADVSAIWEMSSDDTDFENYREVYFLEGDLANFEYFSENIHMMDSASFIGYPGNEKSRWWDMDGELPISRTVHISSLPKKDYLNSSIKTQEVVLVSGLSFSGSSGSPVVLHEKGIKINSENSNTIIKNDSYFEPKIIGIMSGHFWDSDSTPDMFKHSGLSYFTKSTAILELLSMVSDELQKAPSR